MKTAEQMWKELGYDDDAIEAGFYVGAHCVIAELQRRAEANDDGAKVAAWMRRIANEIEDTIIRKAWADD